MVKGLKLTLSKKQVQMITKHMKRYSLAYMEHAPRQTTFWVIKHTLSNLK